jgi:hypothetical protein
MGLPCESLNQMKEIADYLIGFGIMTAFINIIWTFIVGTEVGMEMVGKPRILSQQMSQNMKDLRVLVKKEKSLGKSWRWRRLNLYLYVAFGSTLISMISGFVLKYAF